MNFAEYLFAAVARAGARKIFGLPGDFAIPLFQTLDRLKYDLVTFTHEPALGYAADAYARLNGFAVAVTTYGAGGLNMINAIAQAYAEKSPVLVICGAPEILSRKKNLLVHHRVKTFESQKRIFDEICCASTIIERLEDAPREIDHVIQRILTYKRPGYIEVPRDLCHGPIDPPSASGIQARVPECPMDDSEFSQILKQLIDRINRAERPVIYVGVEIERLNLGLILKEVIEKTNLPFVTSMEGKAAVSETHPNFIGTYMGAVGSAVTRRAMDQSDLILNFGTMMSDVNLGMFTGEVNVAKMVHITSEGLSLGERDYPQYTLGKVLMALAGSNELRRFDFPENLRWHFSSRLHSGRLTTDGIVSVVNEFVRHTPSCITLDVGDMLFAANNICADILLAPCYYASMGFAVPAAIAACLALPKRKTIALVGDGAFQMTGAELGTAVRYGLSPVVIVLNNHGYATMQTMDKKRKCYEVPRWDFVKFAESLGCVGMRVATVEALYDKLGKCLESKLPVLIEADMAPDSVSQSLIKMSRSHKGFSRRK